MRTVILALLVLVVVSPGEALRCKCAGTNRRCASPVVTCSGYNPVCASIVLQGGSHYSYFKSCMKQSDCTLLVNSGVGTGTCCHIDLCN